MAVKILKGSLQTERLSNGRRKLLREFVVEVGGKEYHIPAETFTTDYSSIPWFGRFLVRWSKVDIAGVVHDFLYQNGIETRKYSDDVWRLVALAGEHHANRVQAYLCWLALRIGAGHVWKEYRKQDSF